MNAEKRTLLDPTGEQTPAARMKAPRPDDLAGLTVGLLDISKARGDLFLDRLDERLAVMNVTVRRYSKPTFARIAPPTLLQTIDAECDLVIEALAD